LSLPEPDKKNEENEGNERNEENERQSAGLKINNPQ
jgi:hypothetical protein